ncbi:MAG: hypothetical protein NVSMB17_00710 [Candidatus Dormibacteria bacterium]
MKASGIGIALGLLLQVSVITTVQATPPARHAAVTAAASLPAVTSGARPGPDLLYAPAADAPQLQNVAPWSAAPILVSGAQAYRAGEFLYQDYLYDDRGAASPVADPTDPFDPLANVFSPKHGTVTYPTDPGYANNAADLVELRVKPLATETAFRVTLNTLKDAGRVGFTVALGTSTTARPWPFLAGVTSPAQQFLTVHGTTAVLTDAVTGTPSAVAPSVTVDLRRRQFDVRVPTGAWNPGRSTVRMAAGVGLWDMAGGTYLVPGAVATATRPGGCASACPALFNMAFRLNEPVPNISSPGTANTIVEGGIGVKLDGTWWRERRQGDVLAAGDVSEFNAMVDFGKLRDGTEDESQVPRTGHFDRIMASHFDLGQGVDYKVQCFPANPPECTGRLPGKLQPYAVYVPVKPEPAAGYGLVISMHGLSANYNEFLGSHEAVQFGERGTGSILASPEGRGPDGFYHNYAEADVFEMWNDLAHNYRLNPDLTDVTGYSMGGQGTYQLATRWPDLFARAFPIVGPPSSAASFKSLRNIPVMAWYGQTDELVGPNMSEQAFLAAYQAGIRYDHWLFTPAGHITLGNNDEFGPAAEFLGTAPVDRNPFHVTYVVDPSLDSKSETPANHAYWVSALANRGAGRGTIDAVSRGFGAVDPPVLSPALGVGTLPGGSHGPIPYQRRTLNWGPGGSAPATDRLDITVTNVAAATIDVARARVDCNVDVRLTSDGPTTVTLAGCDRTVSVSGPAAARGQVPVVAGSLPLTATAVPARVLTPALVAAVAVAWWRRRRARRLRAGASDG